MRNKIILVEDLLDLPGYVISNYNAEGYQKVLEVQPYLDDRECLRCNFVVRSFNEVVCVTDELTDAVVAYNKIERV